MPDLPRQRVACYVTRRHDGRVELLVFEHRDEADAGTQVPAGGIDPGESYGDAAVREVREETGLTGVEVVGRLGESDRPHPESGEARLTTYVHLRALDRSPERWTHVVTGTGEDAAMQFDCRWEPLPVTLADDQHELTHRLGD
ncbi:MAG TPA: NUDIX domain-containing protein [Nocardioidaceae bacterium]|nr:NUDIX domain-containing protein [Nocardioidaceae bacterium]